MRTTTQETLAALREIVEGVIDHPDRLKITADEFAGSVFWTIRAAAEDVPKLVGRRGKHVRALALFLELCGKNAGETYRFKLLEPEDELRKQANADRVAAAYDPGPAAALLARAAGLAADSDVRVDVNEQVGAEPRSYRFLAHVADAEALSRALFADPQRHEPRSLAEALAMLWAARGRRDGVRIAVEVSS